MKSMNIYSKEGTKVIFTAEGGYPSEQIKAKEILTVNSIYTVHHTEVHAWYTDVILKEFPDKRFNSALFQVDE